MSRKVRTNNFFEENCGSNDVYNFNKTHANRQEVRDYCNKLLEHHWKYCADNHFQLDAVENPQQRWWEMYLSWVLFNIGGLPGQKTNDNEPDFCISIGGTKIWIEAVSVKPGIGTNEVVRPRPGHAGTLPVNKIVLRVTSAFNDKVKKIQKYIEQNIISPNDAVIIAINTGEIRDSDLSDQYPPLAVQALLGLGSAAFKISITADSVKDDDIEVIFPEQPSVMKNSQSSIATTGLLDNGIISGIFTSTKYFVDMPSTGNDIKILLNPNSNIKLNKNIFNFGTVIDLKI